MRRGPKGRQLLAPALFFQRGRVQTPGHRAAQPPSAPSGTPCSSPSVRGDHALPPSPTPPRPQHLPTAPRGAPALRAGDQPVPAQPRGSLDALEPPSPALPAAARLRGPSLRALLQAGVGI